MSAETAWEISAPGRVFVTIHPDGRVVKGPDITWDECADAFWEAVERHRTQPWRTEADAIAAERERIAKALEKELAKDGGTEWDAAICTAIAIVRGDV